MANHTKNENRIMTLLFVLGLLASSAPVLSFRSNAPRRIGLVTSGGDCPGINAAIRAVVKTASKEGIEVWGIPRGFPGLLREPPWVFRLGQEFASHQMLQRGGSRLGGYVKSDYEEFDEDYTREEKDTRIISALEQLGIEGIIETGGDGSFLAAARLLSSCDISLVGIPKTIDNDVPETLFSIGFQSAVSMAADGISRVRDTAESHRRVIVVEVMGKEAGFLTLHAGIAGGADAILLPEFTYDPDELANYLKQVYEKNQCAIVAVSESIKVEGRASTYQTADGSSRFGGSAENVARFLAEKLGVDARHTVLGHLQRGGSPNAFDQTLASTLGAYAVKELCDGKSGLFVSWTSNGVESVPLDRITGPKNLTAIYPELIAAQATGIFCGTIT